MSGEFGVTLRMIDEEEKRRVEWGEKMAEKYGPMGVVLAKYVEGYRESYRTEGKLGEKRKHFAQLITFVLNKPSRQGLAIEALFETFEKIAEIAGEKFAEANAPF